MFLNVPQIHSKTRETNNYAFFSRAVYNMSKTIYMCVCVCYQMNDGATTNIYRAQLHISYNFSKEKKNNLAK